MSQPEPASEKPELVPKQPNPTSEQPQPASEQPELASKWPDSASEQPHPDWKGGDIRTDKRMDGKNPPCVL